MKINMRMIEMNYTVSQNDTISSIAQNFGVSPTELMTYNNLTSNSFLFPGMIIVIPPARPFPPTPPSYRFYVVRRGDTIWSIASRFNVSIQNIMFANNLTFPVVFPGQRLIIPMRIRPFY